MGNLKELFDRIAKTAGRGPEEEFYNAWLTVMAIYPYETVEKAWLAIRVEVDNYRFFNLKTWVNKCDYLHNPPPKEEAKPVRIKIDDNMRAQVANLKAYQNRVITRRKYLMNCLQNAWMTPAEYDKELASLAKLKGGLDALHGKTVLVKNF